MSEEKQSPGSAVCNLVINGVFAYFFYKYALNNPDQGSCFAKGGNETAYAEIPMITSGSGEDATETPAEGFINVSMKFQTWFLYGFILNCIGMGQSVLQFMAATFESKTMDGISKLIGAIQGLGALVWLITGAIFRWGFVGQVCSGDFVSDGDIHKIPYAAATGKFMKLYLMIVLGIIGTGICCGLIVGVSMGATAARS